MFIHLKFGAAVRAPDGSALCAEAPPAADRAGLVPFPVYLFPRREWLPAEVAPAAISALYLPEALALELLLAHHMGTDPHNHYGGSEIKGRWFLAAGRLG